MDEEDEDDDDNGDGVHEPPSPPPSPPKKKKKMKPIPEEDEKLSWLSWKKNETRRNFFVDSVGVLPPYESVKMENRGWHAATIASFPGRCSNRPVNSTQLLNISLPIVFAPKTVVQSLDAHVTEKLPP